LLVERVDAVNFVIVTRDAKGGTTAKAIHKIAFLKNDAAQSAESLTH
jgi:hypothetical protein